MKVAELHLRKGEQKSLKVFSTNEQQKKWAFHYIAIRWQHVFAICAASTGESLLMGDEESSPVIQLVML